MHGLRRESCAWPRARSREIPSGPFRRSLSRRVCWRPPMPHSADARRPSLGEEAVVFPCAGERLVGILHHAGGAPKIGVVIVTGGPQYRVSSPRQLLLLHRVFAAVGLRPSRLHHHGTGPRTVPSLLLDT